MSNKINRLRMEDVKFPQYPGLSEREQSMADTIAMRNGEIQELQSDIENYQQAVRFLMRAHYPGEVTRVHDQQTGDKASLFINSDGAVEKQS